MPSRVLHRVAVAGLASLGTMLLALALVDMRGLDGRLASAATRQVPTQQVQQQPQDPSADCPSHRHRKGWQQT